MRDSNRLVNVKFVTKKSVKRYIFTFESPPLTNE